MTFEPTPTQPLGSNGSGNDKIQLRVDASGRLYVVIHNPAAPGGIVMYGSSDGGSTFDIVKTDDAGRTLTKLVDATGVVISPATEASLLTRATEATLATRATEATAAGIRTDLGTDGAAPPSIPGTGVRGWLRSIYDRLFGAALTDTDSASATVMSVGGRLMSYDHVADKFLRVHGNSHGGIYVNPQMPSKAIGRTKKEYAGVVTASGTLLTVTASTELHLVDLLVSGINASFAANTRFRLRDGAAGAIKYEFQHGTGAVGAPEHFNQEHGFDEHPIFATEVYLEIVTGTLTLAINLQCYEASH